MPSPGQPPGDGSLVWHQRIAPEDRRIPGNGRIISAWPVRTGCVVQKGMVFATAGLFPQQGTFAACFDAASGRQIWKQSLDISPQGYLLASSNFLYIPTGRSNPIALDLTSGIVQKAFSGVGGSFAVISEDALIAGRGNDGTLAVSDTKTAERFIQIKGTQLAITPDASVYYDAPNLTILDRKRHHSLNRLIQTKTKEHNQLKQQLNRAPVASPDIEALRRNIIQLSESLESTKSSLVDCLKLKFEIGPCSALIASHPGHYHSPTSWQTTFNTARELNAIIPRKN